MRSNAVAALIFISVIAQHFQLFKIGTYSVTLGLITGAVTILLASQKLSLGRLTGAWCSIICLASLAGIFTLDVAISSKFVTTLMMFLVTSLFIVAGTGGMHKNVDAVHFSRAVRAALIVVVAMSVGQVVTGYFNLEVLFNPFGSFQFQRQYEPHLEYVTFPRAHAFFLEPSYDAFVIGTLAVVLLCRTEGHKATMVLSLIGMAACQSVTGLLLILGIALLLVLRSSPRISIPIIIGGSLIIVYLGDYLFSRLGDVGDVGSSGNYRLIAPLKVVSDVLASQPMGMPFGSIYEVVSTYGLKMDGVDQTISLDNGVYVIIYYFGWIGLVAVLLLALWAAHSILKALGGGRSQSYEWIVPPWLVSSLLFSGGIMAPEFGIMTWLVLIAYVEARKKGRIHAAPAAPVHHNRHV